jgi:hypothetical protein
MGADEPSRRNNNTINRPVVRRTRGIALQFTVSVRLLVAPPEVAEIVLVCPGGVGLTVVIGTDWRCPFGGTTTVAGIAANGLVLVKLTVVPEAGAGATSVTVASTGVPPITDRALNTRDATATVG